MVSRLEKEFAEFEIQKEVPTGIYPVDMYLPKLRLCIEIDGSSHYYALTDHELCKSKFKYWLFEQARFDLIRLSYHKYGESRTHDEPHGGIGIKEEQLIADVREAINERKKKVVGVDIENYFVKLLQS